MAIFNSSELKVHDSIRLLSHELPSLGVYEKNLKEEKARKHGVYVNKVLDYIFQLNSYKNANSKFTSIDVKYTEIKPDNATCGIEGWHCDGNTYPFRGNKYFILTSEPTTEMMTTRVSLPAYEGISGKELENLVDNVKYNHVSIKPYTVYEYGCDRFHRGAIAKENTKRLLIRVCCSDYIRPN